MRINIVNTVIQQLSSSVTDSLYEKISKQLDDIEIRLAQRIRESKRIPAFLQILDPTEHNNASSNLIWLYPTESGYVRLNVSMPFPKGSLISVDKPFIIRECRIGCKHLIASSETNVHSLFLSDNLNPSMYLEAKIEYPQP